MAYDIKTISAIKHKIPTSLVQELVEIRKEIHKTFEQHPCKCTREEPVRCCWDCKQSFGHFYRGSFDFLEDILIMSYYFNKTPEELMKEIESLFDKDNGFWTPNGCKLPRMMRSWTCSSFICEDIRHEETGEKIHSLRNKEYEIYKKIKELLK